MNRQLTCTLVIGAVLIVVLPLAAAADPAYLPLVPGNAWTYDGVGGEHEMLTVTGTTQLLGETVIVIEYSESTENEGLENYWTIGAGGDVLLWGFFRVEAGGWGYAYSPPLILIDAPFELGKSWACTTMFHDLPGEVPAFEDVRAYEFAWEGPLTVPAGTFASVGVGELPGPTLSVGGRSFSADGRVLNRQVESSRWYSDGIGPVQYDATDLYQRSEYGLSPVESLSWSSIKALYQ